jgi:pantothenate kinase type III
VRKLLIDAGNSFVKVSLEKNGKIYPLFKIPTDLVLESPTMLLNKIKNIEYSHHNKYSTFQSTTCKSSEYYYYTKTQGGETFFSENY